MKKRLLLTALLIVLSFCCIFSVSADEPTLSLKCGDNILCTFDEKTETIYVEGNGKMSDCNILDCKIADTDKTVENAEEMKSKYKKLVISDGITHIGNDAFAGFVGIADVQFGKDIATIGDRAFKETGIKNLVIPDTVTQIGEEAFCFCYFLENVTIGKSVTDIGKKAFFVNMGVVRGAYYFEEATYAKTITVPETVKNIGDYAFGFEWDEMDDMVPDIVRGLGAQRIKDFVLIGAVDSAAYEYCEKFAVAFDDIDGCDKGTHKWGGRQTVREKVCQEQVAIYCNQCKKCGARRYELGEDTYHNYLKGSKVTVREATYFKKAKVKAYCLDCGKYITYKTEKLEVEKAEYKAKRGKNQISFTFTNDEDKVSYYKVTVYTYNKKGRKDLKSYTVEDKELTVKGLKKNKKYYFEIESYYKQGKKTAKSVKTVTVKTKK